MSARVSTATAIVVLGLSVVGVGLSTWAGGGDAFALAGLPFAVVGALLLLRGAGHRIGWVLSGIGLLTCTGPASAMIAAMQVADGRPPDAATLALAGYSEWYWVPFLHLTLVGLPVLLPTGELRSLRARRVWNVMLVSIAATTALAMFQGVLLADEDTIPIANPVGWLPYDDVDHTPLVFAIIAAVILLGGVAVLGVVRRLRRAAGVERQQLKVVTFGVVASVGGFVLNIASQAVIGTSFPQWAIALVIGITPVAVLVAILRYRLFEIDRLVSRTVTYAVVSTVLIAVYSAVTVVPSAAFNLQSDLLVAAATLAAAAVFVPCTRASRRPSTAGSTARATTPCWSSSSSRRGSATTSTSVHSSTTSTTRSRPRCSRRTCRCGCPAGSRSDERPAP